MSGTSLDGIDAVAVAFSDSGVAQLLGHHHLHYDDALRAECLALNTPCDGELERAALLANVLSRHYADAVRQLLELTGLPAKQVRAIGCHGQTVRHRPDLGYTLQLVNPALLAELSSIPVVADFRSRDLAAGGQGAPLVPAFHAAAFQHPEIHRIIVNIGGIANLTDLPPQGPVSGFDCGPGNLLLDGWANRHLGSPYDDGGRWAQSGIPIPELLDDLLATPFFSGAPPKSTGRDLFNLSWLERFLSPVQQAADIQATLLELTACGIGDALGAYCQGAREVYLCGGGAHNTALVQRLKQRLPALRWKTTDALGIPVDQVEACAFAWLARQALDGKTGNLPEVTGARGARVLGAVYPA
jgi:anhydro-N-acetylmuramic acid kinase